MHCSTPPNRWSIIEIVAICRPNKLLYDTLTEFTMLTESTTFAYSFGNRRESFEKIRTRTGCNKWAWHTRMRVLHRPQRAGPTKTATSRATARTSIGTYYHCCDKRPGNVEIHSHHHSSHRLFAHDCLIIKLQGLPAAPTLFFLPSSVVISFSLLISYQPEFVSVLRVFGLSGVVRTESYREIGRVMQAMEDLGLQRLRDRTNAALSQVEPVILVVATVVTWIVMATTSSVLSGAYSSVSEKGNCVDQVVFFMFVLRNSQDRMFRNWHMCTGFMSPIPVRICSVVILSFRRIGWHDFGLSRQSYQVSFTLSLFNFVCAFVGNCGSYSYVRFNWFIRINCILRSKDQLRIWIQYKSQTSEYYMH